jgi:hypothetical protein
MSGFRSAVVMADDVSAEIEAAALAGREVRTNLGGYDCWDGIESPHPDFELVRVNTRGCGNMGDVYARGRTPRGRAVVRAGKIARLTACGVAADVAAVAVSMPYGMEVAALAGALIPHVWRGVDGLSGVGRARFEGATAAGITSGFSMPRAWAAWDIAVEIVRRETPSRGNGWEVRA